MHIHTNQREELMRSKARPEAALRWGRPLGAALLALALAACGGGGSLIGADATIGGSVTGLSGAGLVLRNNGSESLSVPAAGRFAFVNPVPRGAAYAVTVATQPAGQTCVVANGSGTAPDAGNVENIGVTCTNTTPPPPPPAGSYTIGGNVSGLTGSGLVLNNNGGNDLAVTANGAFTFSTAIAGGAAYAVTVATPPSGQRCDVANGSGTVAAANVTSVAVTCTSTSPPPPPPNTYSVGGSITGYTGRGLVLQLNGGDGITLVAGATTFAFPGQLASGSNYAVTVAVPAYGQDCSLTNASGSIDSANVNNVLVTCGPVAPLTLVSGTPGGETGVARTVQPRLTFSAAIDPATVNGASVAFLSSLSGSSVPAAATVGFDGASMTLTPTQKLLPLTNYGYTVSTDVRGVRGQQLAVGVEGGFTTGDGAWKAPNTFDGFANREGQIVMNLRGNAIAVGRDVSGTLLAYHYDVATGTWGSPRTLLLTAVPRSPLSLAIDDAGNAIVVGLESVAATGGVVVSDQRYDAGQDAWIAPRTRSNQNSTAYGSKVAVLPDGSVLIAYAHSVAGGDHIWTNRTRGILESSFGDNLLIRRLPDGSSFRSLNVAVGGDRANPVASVSWEQNDSGVVNLTVWASLLRQGTFGAAAAISRDDGSLELDHRVAIDRAGRSYVVWTQDITPFRGVWLRRHDGVAWQPFELVGDASNGNAYSPTIAVSRLGDSGVDAVSLVWTQQTTGATPVAQIWTSRIVSNGVRSPRLLLSDPAINAQVSEVVVDRAGNALVVWMQDNFKQIVSRRYDAGRQSWNPVSTRLNEADTDALRALTVDSSGDVFLGWVESTGSASKLRVRRFD
jgi:hypothetical protein